MGFFSILLCLGCQRRKPAVRRIDNQRGLACWLSAFRPIRRRADSRAGVTCRKRLAIGFSLPLCLRLPLLEFLVRQRRSFTKVYRTLHWNTCIPGPDAL